MTMSKVLSPTERITALRYFLWWFAWGIFSAVMILIVMKGAGLSLAALVFMVLALGVLAGSVALCLYIKRLTKQGA